MFYFYHGVCSNNYFEYDAFYNSFIVWIWYSCFIACFIFYSCFTYFTHVHACSASASASVSASCLGNKVCEMFVYKHTENIEDVRK